jgi:hypothetical protein
MGRMEKSWGGRRLGGSREPCGFRPKWGIAGACLMRARRRFRNGSGTRAAVGCLWVVFEGFVGVGGFALNWARVFADFVLEIFHSGVELGIGANE